MSALDKPHLLSPCYRCYAWEILVSLLWETFWDLCEFFFIATISLLWRRLVIRNLPLPSRVLCTSGSHRVLWRNARRATSTVFVATITKLLLRQTHNTQLSNTHYGFTTMLLPRNVKNYRDLGVFTKRRKDCARICKARPGTDLHALTERVTWLWQAFVLLARHANTKGDDGTPFRALWNSKSAISVDILQNPCFCFQDWRITLDIPSEPQIRTHVLTQHEPRGGGRE